MQTQSPTERFVITADHPNTPEWRPFCVVVFSEQCRDERIRSLQTNGFINIRAKREKRA